METRDRIEPTDPLENELARLFAAYREACPDPELSAGFLPRLWQRIEEQQSLTREVKRLTEVLVAAAVALSLVMGVFLSSREPTVSFYSGTYVEVLAANYAPDAPLDPESVLVEQEYPR